MKFVNIIAFIILLIGALNWGLVGIFNWNFVSAIFGTGINVWSSIIYVLVFLSGCWLVFSAIYSRGRIELV